MAADSSAATAVADAEMAVAITAVSGSSYCFSSVAAETVLVVAAILMVVATIAAATLIVAAAHHGTTVVEIPVETTVAANFFGNSPGGIFGCPSCHGSNPTLIETLKLFLPYFPLHIQHLISLYLNFLEFMHTFQLIQNMMNHMEEYQALFKMFETQGNEQASSNPFASFASFVGGNEFSMPDLSSVHKMMEGSDLEDEFTYVEESPGSDRYGS